MGDNGARFIYCPPFQSNLFSGVLHGGQWWNIYSNELYGLYNEPGISKLTQ
jgi:hypothetical protein